MQTLDLLLVGSAGDGPTEEVVAVRDLAHALQLFGGWAHELHDLTTSESGATLSQLPWDGRVDVLQFDSDGALVPRILFEFAVVGGNLTWTPNGDWDRYQDSDPSVNPTLTFRYRLAPAATSLLRAIYQLLDGEQPVPVRLACVRLGGTAATAATGSGLSFIARTAGARYNGTEVVKTGGSVAVTPAPGTGRKRVYAPASDRELAQLMERDRDRGWLPLYLAGQGSNTALTLPDGTYTLAGGADGALTAELLQEFLASYDLTGVDVLCPVGLTLDQLEAGGILETLAESAYPTLLVAESTWEGSDLALHPNLHRSAVSVASSAIFSSGEATERTENAAPRLAGLIAASRTGLTRQAFGVPLPTNPGGALLREAAAAGHLLLYRSISAGPAVWNAVTGDTAWPVTTYRCLQEAARICWRTLEPYLGRVLLDVSGLENQLAQALAGVGSGRVSDVSLRLAAQRLYAQLTLQPDGEIREVQAQLTLASGFEVP